MALLTRFRVRGRREDSFLVLSASRYTVTLRDVQKRVVYLESNGRMRDNCGLSDKCSREVSHAAFK